MCKITHGLAPSRLLHIIQNTSSSQNYNLRGSTTNFYLPTPKPKPKTQYLKKGFVTAEQNCGIAFQ